MGVMNDSDVRAAIDQPEVRGFPSANQNVNPKADQGG
jgi:hypothetical protein